MPTYVRVQTASGQCRGIGSTPRVAASADEHEVVVNRAIDLAVEMWDVPTQAFVSRPAPVLVDRLIDLRDHAAFQDFRDALLLLTPDQRATVRNAVVRLLGRHRYRRDRQRVEEVD